ncbi:pentatricopeptide repeat-containing protein [Citrus sinensis]|nr:pentatricopeptide repeat-containing protein [Citrus sinensis]
MGKKGQTRMAMRHFSEMRNSRFRPDASVYNAFITARLRTRDKVKALAKVICYFEKVKGMEPCRPNIVTYNILLIFWLKLEITQRENPSLWYLYIQWCNTVMDEYGKRGMIKEMESVLSRMKSTGVNLILSKAYDKIERLFKSSMRFKEKPTLPTFTDFLFESSHKMRVTPALSTYKLLYKAYAKANIEELMQKLVKHMEQNGIVLNKRFVLEALKLSVRSSLFSSLSARAKTDSSGCQKITHLCVFRFLPMKPTFETVCVAWGSLAFMSSNFQLIR